MENVTEQKLGELVSWLVDTAKSTESFVLEQAPDVARQIVAWGFWGWTLRGVVNLAVAAALCLLVLYLVKKVKALYDDDEMSPGTLGVGIAIAACSGIAIYCIFSSGDAFLWAAKVHFAPKVYLIEQAAKLLK